MAQRNYEDHLLSDDVIIVSKDDGTKTRRFTNSEEADAYYEYLKREEVQDSIAKNQAAAVAQNKEIIANQQRLIEAQERNNRIPPRPPFPQPTRQILDPDYKEWLQFKKETDPEYKKWKKAKEAEEIRKRQEESARAAKLQAEREEQERERQRQLRLEKERQERKIQEEIRPAEDDLMNGKPVTDRIKVAMYTKNQQVIDILKVSSSQKILEALSRNSSIKVVDMNFAQKKLNDLREKEARERAAKAERERKLKEEQARIQREKTEREENFKTALKWIIGIAVVGLLIWLLIHFAKWIFAVIFIIALIIVFFSN